MEQATCSIEDCPQTPYARGMCRKCYRRAWYRGFADDSGKKKRHVVSDFNQETGMGTCALCGPVKATYKRDKNFFLCETQRKRWNGPEKYTPEAGRRWRLRKKYGITVAQYDEMYEAAEGRCEICRTPYPLLCVDHDHETGAVRGLLCTPCNQGLGSFRDDPARIAAAGTYLTRVATRD